MHKFVAELCSYKKTKNYQTMPQINVYSTFVSYSWILYQCYMRKKTKQTKVKSESLMLSSREPNKLKCSSHQQEYSKDSAVKKEKKEKRKKIAGKLYASYSSNQQNMLLHTMEHKQNAFPVRYRNVKFRFNFVDG